MNWDAITSKHIAILGKTGSGKTFAAKGIVEWLVNHGRQVCIIDPTSAWWGLRLGADGKSKGVNVIILGGDHGDVPLSERSGNAAARLVTEQGASVVIDTGGMGVGEYTRWFADFAGTLYTTIRNPLHLVIDEAHYFMPQASRASDPQTGKMLHAGNRLISGGRSRGIRAVMITQRPAKLHKDSLTCADTLIAMQLIAPQDRGAVEEWIDGCGNPDDGKKVLDSLASLRHEGWVWFPEGGILERHKFPQIKTYDSSAAPKHGEQKSVQLGDIDLSAVKAAMAEAVKEAEANDPVLLKRRIAELERVASAKAKPTLMTIDQGTIDRAVAQAIKIERQAWERRESQWQRARKHVSNKLANIADIATTNGFAWPDEMAPEKLEPIRQTTITTTLRPATPTMAASTGTAQLTRLERALLTVLAQRPDEFVGKARILTLANYTSNGTTSAAFARYVAEGWVESRQNELRITPAGAAALGEFEPLPSGEDLRNLILRGLTRLEAALLTVLFESYPESVAKGDILSRAGYTSNGTTSAAFAKFVRAGWAEISAPGSLRASETLFSDRP